MLIYLVENKANGKKYVGKTERSLQERWEEHLYHASTGDDKMVFYAAIRKYGTDGFVKTIIDTSPTTIDELNAAERFWIAEHKSFGPGGYNMTAGGDGISGYRHTEETKRKMSEDRKGEKSPCYGKRGELNPLFGRKIGSPSDETRQKIREAKLGVKRSSEACQAIAEGQYVEVEQCDMQWNFIKKHKSLKHAAEETEILFQNISRACRYPNRSAGGFKWRYAANATPRKWKE